MSAGWRLEAQHQIALWSIQVRTKLSAYPGTTDVRRFGRQTGSDNHLKLIVSRSDYPGSRETMLISLRERLEAMGSKLESDAITFSDWNEFVETVEDDMARIGWPR